MGIFSKRSTIYGILNQRCPQCHEGKLFENPILTFKDSFVMKDDCEVCGQNYMPEPGYYYGAMLISYIMSATFCLSFVFFCKLVLGFTTNQSFILLLIVCSVAFIWVFRMARSIWINFDIGYKGPPDQKLEKPGMK